MLLLTVVGESAFCKLVEKGSIALGLAGGRTRRSLGSCAEGMGLGV